MAGKTIAYLDMIGGVSGDILLGAILDVGLRLDDLRAELEKLPDRGYDLSAERVKRGALDATLLHVDLDDDGRRPRGFADFTASIEQSGLSYAAKQTAVRIFDALENAETAAHGGTPGHLHELATVDTLVDVVGAVAGLELLGIDRLHASPFPAGSGSARSEHGPMAGVSPATMAIYQTTGAPVRAGGATAPPGETVTPTGAAIVTAVADFSPVSMTIERSGYGAGQRDPSTHPNVAGLWLGEEVGSAANVAPVATGLTLLETNIDDMPGELFGHVQERLFELGARDVWFTPIQMKKNRPGVLLSVLVPDDTADTAADLLFTETSTFGIRLRPVERYEADRELVDFDSSLGRVTLKLKKKDGKVIQVAPEYEDCRRIAAEHDLGLAEVMDRIRREAHSRPPTIIVDYPPGR